MLACLGVSCLACGCDAPRGDTGARAPGMTGGAGEAGDSGYDTDADTCTSGDTRCQGDLAFQHCTPDGTWSEAISCAGYAEDGSASYCAVVNSGGQRWAACVDPACFWWLGSGLGVNAVRVGVCAPDGSIAACDASGVLSAREPCAGECQRVGTIDGRALGYCRAECREGEQECIAGPYYRACQDGHWSAETQTCAAGERCQSVAEGPRRTVTCSRACEPGTARCSADAGNLGIEACQPDGLWAEATPCALGRCVQNGAQAQCQIECKPDEQACAFDGDTVSRQCGSTGLWQDPSPCLDGTRCRVGKSRTFGCVSCVGARLSGGNVWGVVDSHCSANGVAECAVDDTFAEGVACPVGTVCTEATRGAASVAYCQ